MFHQSTTEKVEDRSRPFVAIARDKEAREHLMAAAVEARQALRRAAEVRHREERHGRRTLGVLLLVVAAAGAYAWYWLRKEDEPYAYAEHPEGTGAFGAPDVDVTGTTAGDATGVTTPTGDLAPTASSTGSTDVVAAGAAGAAAETSPEALAYQHRPDETAVLPGMPDIDREELLALRGADVVGPDGSKIGTLQEVFFDDDTGRPEWALVAHGTFSTKVTFVPLRSVSIEDRTLRVAFDAEAVKSAPTWEGEGRISESEEDALYRHYGTERPSAAELRTPASS